MNQFIRTIVIFALVAVNGGCSESGKPQAPAPIIPEVRIYYPVADETRPVADSTEIYVGVGAATVASVARVEFLFARRNRVLPDTIGFETEPVDTSIVPQAIKPYLKSLPRDWQLYRRWWYPGPQYRPPKGTYVPSGERVQLFAVALQADGSEGRSGLTQVRVLSQDAQPLLFPCFTVAPPAGQDERCHHL